MSTLKSIAAGAVIAGSLGLAAFGLGSGTASAAPSPAAVGTSWAQWGHGGPGGPEWGPPPPGQEGRGIDQGRFDHQPFNYNGNWVQPIYNQDYNNWGFWFFGIWIPL